MKNIVNVTLLYSKEHPEHVMEFLYHGVEKHKGFSNMRLSFIPYGQTFSTSGKTYAPTIRYYSDGETQAEIVTENIGKALDSIQEKFPYDNYSELHGEPNAK